MADDLSERVTAPLLLEGDARSCSEVTLARSLSHAGEEVEGLTDAVGERDEVVEEPGAARPDEGPPVELEREEERRTSLDGPVAVQLRVDHAQAEQEDDERWDDRDAEDGAPNGRVVGVVAAGGRVDDEVQDAGEDGAERENEVGDLRKEMCIR